MIEKPNTPPPLSKLPMPPPISVGSFPFPEIWTAEIAALAKEHAREMYPNEVSGIVTKDCKYERLDNKSKEPTEEVGVSDEDAIRISSAAVYFHSHPNGPACPSLSDMWLQMQLEIPFVIYCVDTNDLFCWGHGLHKPPLLGRAFRHGIFDCYSLVRDWFKEEKGVELIDRPREWDWWLHGENFYERHFSEAGFMKIPKEEATQIGDALLFKFNYRVIMHAAIVVEKDLLLHHISGQYPYDPTRLSATVPRTRWVRHALTGMRYVGRVEDAS